MFVMYDNTNLLLVPNGPHAVGCYRNGKFANENVARSRFPHARILPISVAGMIACDCYDIETGDYRPEHAGELYKIAHAAGIWRPCFYAPLFMMNAVRDSLRPVIKQRNDVRLWVASFDNVPLIPPGYDAKQFTDHALGRSLDESICLDTFFQPLKPPPPAPDKELQPRAIVEYDPDGFSWKISNYPWGHE